MGTWKVSLLSFMLLLYFCSLFAAPALGQTGTVCTPGRVAGCSVCNAQGTAWADDNSKCASGQICQNWACVSSATGVRSSITSATCNTITGWICDPANPSKQFWVEFYLDETTNAGYLGWSGMATISRPEITSQCGGSAAHGFTFTIPATTNGSRVVADGRAHTIHMAAKDSNGNGWYILTGSPRTLTCSGSSSCTNECSTTGARQCSGNAVQTCGNYDTDSCLEWSAATACTTGQTCSGGQCSSQGSGSSQAGAIVVTAQTAGITERSIGANEGDRAFNINDLVDAGVKNYRIYSAPPRFIWDSEGWAWGSVTIDQIKANPNLIDWTKWEAAIRDTNGYATGYPGKTVGSPCSSKADCQSHVCNVNKVCSWRYHGRSLYDMLTQLKANGITPVVQMSNYWVTAEWGDTSKGWGSPPAGMGIAPPKTQADYNELWERTFASVYVINVRNNLDVNDWQISGEPDGTFPGTLAEYIKYSQTCYDAIKYVYDKYLPGKTFRFYDPVTGAPGGPYGETEYIKSSIIQNGARISAIDWHQYGPTFSSDAATIQGWLSQYGAGQKPLYLSEWGFFTGQGGTYNGYDEQSNAMTYAKYLMDHSVSGSGHIDQSSIFSLYDWGQYDTLNYFPGLISESGAKTPSYYAFRMVTRAFQGGKTIYVLQNAPQNSALRIAATRDTATNTLYITVLNEGTSAQNLVFNIGAHVSSGSATIRRYSETSNDAAAGTSTVSGGVLNMNCQASSITQAIVSLGGSGGGGVSGTVCTPGAVAGCGVCNAQGTAWADDNSRCQAGQVCQNWACIVSSQAVKSAFSADCSTLTGWVCDPASPNKQFWVEFYLDETTSAGYLGYAMATESYAPLAPQCGGSSAHQFTLAMPSATQGGRQVNDGRAHTFHAAAKDSNGNGWYLLTASPKTLTCSSSARASAFVLSTPESCAAGQDCASAVANCSSGIILLRNIAGNPINITKMILDRDLPIVFFSREGYQRRFSAAGNGTVGITAICLEGIISIVRREVTIV